MKRGGCREKGGRGEAGGPEGRLREEAPEAGEPQDLEAGLPFAP